VRPTEQVTSSQEQGGHLLSGFPWESPLNRNNRCFIICLRGEQDSGLLEQEKCAEPVLTLTVFYSAIGLSCKGLNWEDEQRKLCCETAHLHATTTMALNALLER
jgi:hypothetical protein